VLLLLLPCSAAECRTLPHIAHLTVASVFSVVFILVGGLFALADVTPNPVSQNWLATAHAGVEVKTWVFKTAIVLCANVLTGFPKLQVTPILVFATWIAYVHVRWVSVMVTATAATSAFAVPCLKWKLPHSGNASPVRGNSPLPLAYTFMLLLGMHSYSFVQAAG
jgi:hypothetical protein